MEWRELLLSLLPQAVHNRSKDREGFTCTPEIAPPIARTVDRDSGTDGVQTYSLW